MNRVFCIKYCFCVCLLGIKSVLVAEIWLQEKLALADFSRNTGGGR